MRTVLLTTDTPHHTFFAWKIHEVFPWEAIVLESRVLRPPFNIFHPFEQQRDEYEKSELLKNFKGDITQLANSLTAASVNDPECVEYLKSINPDVIIVFGTGKINSSLIQIPRLGCLNLHGGDPERYRGLDTHLWAIYHQEFDQLITTLHYIDETLDTGDVVFKATLPISRGLQLHQLRAVNTQVCVKLSLLALMGLHKNEWLPSMKQLQIGRYYSFMPAELKEICLKRFNKFTQGL